EFRRVLFRSSLIATWFVLFLVYSIALTQTFGLTKIGPNSNGNLNFRTVPKAMIVLFRMSCGEGWNDIMTDFELKEPYCIKSSEFLDSDCGSEGYARALFISWNIISMYIFVSLVRHSDPINRYLFLTLDSSLFLSFSRVSVTCTSGLATFPLLRVRSCELLRLHGCLSIQMERVTSPSKNSLVYCRFVPTSVKLSCLLIWIATERRLLDVYLR